MPENGCYQRMFLLAECVLAVCGCMTGAVR